jgi:hypothetical protein
MFYNFLHVYSPNRYGYFEAELQAEANVITNMLVVEKGVKVEIFRGLPLRLPHKSKVCEVFCLVGAERNNETHYCRI